MLLGQHGVILVGTWCYWVSRRRYCLVLGDTGSIWGGTGWFLVILVGTLWYLVSIEWYWLIYDGAVSVEGSSGWYLVVLGQY